jgi:hypothetical protein
MGPELILYAKKWSWFLLHAKDTHSMAPLAYYFYLTQNHVLLKKIA